MSLQNLAHSMQSSGRGGDTMLVHMNPKEVAGLQQLAMAHGGSLTINPETGLPEAGFLSSLLPTIIGAALTIGTGGAINPMTAGLITGAGTGLMTGNLKKGLMAGLGAFGGAGMGAGLMSASSLASTAPALVNNNLGAAFQTAGSTVPASIATTAAPVAAGNTALNLGAANQSLVANTVGNVIPNTAGTAAAYAPVQQAAAQQVAVQNELAKNAVGGVNGPPSVFSGMGDRFAQAGSGLKNILTNQGGAGLDFLNDNKMNLAASLGSAMMTPEEREKKKIEQAIEMQRYAPAYTRFEPSARAAGSTAERYYLAAEGGAVPGPEDHGTIEQMSQMNQNSMGDNMRYPMASQSTPTYAMPAERPISQNIIYPATDAPAGMAGGGIASLTSFAAGGPAKSQAQLDEEAAVKEFNEFLKNRKLDLSNSTKEYDTRKSDITKDYTKRIADFNKETTAEAAKKQKEINAEIASRTKDISTELANRNRDLNSEFTSRQNDVNSITDKAEKTNAQRELNEWKANTTKEINEWKTNTNADFSKWKTESTADLTNFNKDRVRELGEIQSNQKNDLANWQKERNAGIADINKDITERQSLRNFDNSVFKNAYTGYSSDIKGDDWGALSKGYDTEIGKQKSEADKAKQALAAAQKTGIQSLIDRAQDKYNQQQGEYEEATRGKDERQNQFREETKRATSGIAARGSYTSTPAAGNNVESLQAQIANIKANPAQTGYTMGSVGQRSLSADQEKQIKTLEDQIKTVSSGKQVYNPKTGQYEADTSKTFKSLTAAPGYDTTKKIMEEEDVRQMFEEVAGRSPTQNEMAKYLGKSMTQADLAKGVSALSELGIAQKFKDEDLNAQAKYYWGRDMTKGELAYFKDPANKLTNFNTLRTAMQNNPEYLKNLNKINQAAFNKTIDADKAAAEGPASLQQVSSAYNDIFGKPPTQDQLQAAINSGASYSQLKAQLQTSPEYATKMTQPLVPEIKQTAATMPAINTRPAPPPISQAQIDQYRQQYNAPTAGSQSAAQLGLAPLFAGTGQGGYTFNQPQQQASIEGALPYQDIINRLGIGGVYQQIADKAPALQGGMQFNVPQGYTPIGQTARPQGMAMGGMAEGDYNLGGYSDGGRLLRGPGDGVSDSIPASIGNRQPARLADGEFVIPARIVSELGNGSTEAGARQLYAMMDRVQKKRRSTVGKGKVAVNSRAEKMLPA